MVPAYTSSYIERKYLAVQLVAGVITYATRSTPREAESIAPNSDETLRWRVVTNGEFPDAFESTICTRPKSSKKYSCSKGMILSRKAVCNSARVRIDVKYACPIRRSRSR